MKEKSDSFRSFLRLSVLVLTSVLLLLGLFSLVLKACEKKGGSTLPEIGAPDEETTDVDGEIEGI